MWLGLAGFGVRQLRYVMEDAHPNRLSGTGSADTPPLSKVTTKGPFFW